jgi:hypothetical protein
MVDEKPKVPSPITVMEQSPDFKQVYCNHTRLGMTPYDLVLTCGHIAEKTPNDPIILEDVSIRFSPQTFKFLALTLSSVMAAWEAQWGPVQIRSRTPEEIFTAFKESADQLKKERGL